MFNKKYFLFIAIAIFASYSALMQAVAGNVVLGTVINNSGKPIQIRADQAQQPLSAHMATVQPGRTILVNRPIPISLSSTDPQGATLALRRLGIQTQPAQNELLKLEFERAVTPPLI